MCVYLCFVCEKERERECACLGIQIFPSMKYYVLNYMTNYKERESNRVIEREKERECVCVRERERARGEELERSLYNFEAV